MHPRPWRLAADEYARRRAELENRARLVRQWPAGRRVPANAAGPDLGAQRFEGSLPCRRTPPHDHGTWASILLLSGGEKNTLYRTENGALRKAGESTLTPGAVLTMRTDTAHVAECLGDTPAIGLHVYGGDIFTLPRRMWHPQTLEAHALDWGVYENFARMAPAAADAPAP